MIIPVLLPKLLIKVNAHAPRAHIYNKVYAYSAS